MAKFELPIYGDNDEIIKTYATDHVAWAIFIKAADLEPKIRKLSAGEMFVTVGDILKEVFKGLTDEELNKADGMDVINTFSQIVSGGHSIKGGNSKNA